MSSAQRKKELDEKLKELKEAYLTPTSVIKTFRWDADERSLSVRLVIDEESFRFSFYIPEDFPDMRPMISIDGDGDDDDELSRVVEKVNEYADKPSASIGSIIHNFLLEMAKIREFKVPKVGGLASSAVRPLKRSLKESVGGSDDEEEDEEYYDDEETGQGEQSRLMKHSALAQLLFGSETVLVYPFIDTVRLQLPTSFLTAELRRKLGVTDDYHASVVISVQFGSGDYILDRRVPTVKSMHPKEHGTHDKDVKSGLGEQIENMARQYLERVWPSMHCEATERVLTKLNALGYDMEFCAVALEKNNYDFDAAQTWLVETVPLLKGHSAHKHKKEGGKSHGKKEAASSTSKEAASAKKEGGWFGIGGGKKKKQHGESASTSTTATAVIASPSTRKQQRRLASREHPDLQELIAKGYKQLAMAQALYGASNNVTLAVDAYLAAGGKLEDAAGLKAVVDKSDYTERNVVVELTAYLLRRMLKPIGFCLICDKRMVNHLLADPAICTVGTCQFNYIELGVCSSIPVSFCPTTIADDIMNNPDVVDLYISMAVATATSARKNDIFNPFPPNFERGGTKDFDGVTTALQRVPSVDDMRKHCGSERQLINFLATHDPTGASYDMLTWLLSYNRAALLKMPPTLHIEQMQTKHQYMMTAGTDPEKTAKFKAWRKEYGSYFAFHGSSIENWHSILRVGLLNLSGTKLMTTGAAYGPGVYLAPDSGTSMGYARTGAAWSKSKFGDSSSLVCLAIAEVVKHPDVPHTPNPYYVVRNADHVTTRFFLFYPGGSRAGSIQASTLDLSKYV